MMHLLLVAAIAGSSQHVWLPDGANDFYFQRQSVQYVPYDPSACVSTVTGAMLSGPCLPSYDDTDLGRAMSICDRHRGDSGTVFYTTPPVHLNNYAPGWHSCETILAKWRVTEAGKAERAAVAKDKSDHDFVDRVAGVKP